MLLDDIKNKRDEITAVAKRHGAVRVRVFGSVIRGEETPESDVDFLVDFPQGYNMLHQRMPLTEQLAAIVGRPIDLIPEQELSPLLRDRILSEATEL